MFLSSKSNNNNCSVITLNTDFFKRSAFQYASRDKGYKPQEQLYIYGLRNGAVELKDVYLKDIIYLGGMQREKGVPIGTQPLTSYKDPQWGNVFYYEYFNHIRTTFISSKPPDQLLKQTRTATDTIGETTATQLKEYPYYYTERYNPYKDKGDGNMAYWLSVSDATKNNWEPPKDPDLIIQGYPFWLMLWGWEDYTKKCGKIRDFDNNAILVLQSRYISGTHKYYVPLSDSFVNGRAPYDNDPDEITPNDNSHWFPKWKFQKEAIDNILMTGPGVVKAEEQQSIQAFIKYNFFFKWGGNSSTLETISDPNSQPITPSPPGLFLQNEITDPKTPIENMLYKWDIRRHLLTQAATTRIKEIETHDECLFTDGAETSTDYPLQTAPQEEKTPANRKRDITPPPPTARAIQQPTTTATPQTPATNRTINFTLIKKAYLFEPPKTKLTPITGRDWEDELYISKWLKRPMRRFLEDKPYYPWLPPEPIVNQPLVNFDIVSAFNKGQH